MIFHEPPPNFHPRFTVVSCFMESDGEILLLKRQTGKSEGDRWGTPGGKIDANEEAVSSLIREVREETGIALLPASLVFVRIVYVRNAEYDFVYHIFRTVIPKRPIVQITPNEHQDFQWITPSKALHLDLVRDEDACIRLVYRT